MMDFLRKNTRTIFTVTIIAFLAGTFIGFGSYALTKSDFDTVAEVNGAKISYNNYIKTLNRTLENIRNNKGEITQELINQKKQEVLQDMIQEEVFWQEAKKYGIGVADGELLADLRRYPAFQRDGQFDRQSYFRILFEVLRTTPKEFEESRKREIAFFKLRQFIASSVIVSEPELQYEYRKTHKNSMANYEKNRDKFMEETRQKKVQMVFNDWFKSLNQSLKVKIHLDEIEKGRG